MKTGTGAGAGTGTGTGANKRHRLDGNLRNALLDHHYDS